MSGTRNALERPGSLVPNEGKNSLGLAAIRQIRDMLVERYPGVRALSGQRITGAVSADRRSGSGPGREATQTVRGDQ
jgi:hypothetical protein